MKLIKEMKRSLVITIFDQIRCRYCLPGMGRPSGNFLEPRSLKARSFRFFSNRTISLSLASADVVFSLTFFRLFQSSITLAR